MAGTPMQQALHLFIVDRRRGDALAAWHGSRWLLPVLTCGERTRAGPAVARWAAEHGIAGDVVGQWLGRVSPRAADWLMVISTARPRSSPDRRLTWSPLDTLSPDRALFDYQGWAVARSLRCGPLPSVGGPFGSLTWIDDVRDAIGAAAGTVADAMTPYRVTSHEVVLGAQTSSGRVYFKGLARERAGEARLTRTLAALAPCSFARTLAFEERSDGTVWWLTAACAGEPNPDPERVSQALARIQQRLMTSGSGLRQLPPVNLADAVQWVVELGCQADCVAAIERHVDRVVAAVAPESWIPLDLDPTNVLAGGNGEVAFIDLDDSFLGPAPLAMATFARRCRNASLYRAYEQSWSPPLTDAAWPHLEVVATVLEGWLGWQRVERTTRSGHLHGALDRAAATIRERLTRCIHRR